LWLVNHMQAFKQHKYAIVFQAVALLPRLAFILGIGILVGMFSACTSDKKPEMTPWGTTIGEDSIPSSTRAFGLSDIEANGEMIMLTLTGPETYYDYHGRGMGLNYLLCQKFAEKIGVSLRVEVCKDTTEMVDRLKRGEGDVVAVPLPMKTRGVKFAGPKVDSLKTSWAVNDDSQELADSLNSWFKPNMIAEVRSEEDFLLSTRSIRRHVYAPMLNRSGGVISRYDRYFQTYAPIARWDWRLMAAQCYQESCFDPEARSWAGACGLMQIMPSTADHLGMPRSELFNPERNIAGAARYIQELNQKFADVPASERVYYVLASYNGGFFHIRDAMALAKKNGRSPHRWADVSEYVLKLSSPQYYNDPVVRYGYMRGTETVDYVQRIRDRWAEYRGVAKGGAGHGFFTSPERARRNYRWHL
jgi:membrane-bound lytic murein transglycosylase F